MKIVYRGLGWLVVLAVFLLLSGEQEVARGQEPPAYTYYLPSVYKPFGCEGVTEIPQQECEALVALWIATNPGWLGGAPVSWSYSEGWLNTAAPCSWFGIVCTEGHVSRIQLVQINLVGTVPPEIGNLSALELLFLEGNQLSSLPPEVGNLLNLRWLYLNDNQLSSLPPQIGNLSKLWHLHLAGNQLSSLPPEVGSLSDS